jgi:vacuolar-type H+-ATPase subunit F/Vma7
VKKDRYGIIIVTSSLYRQVIEEIESIRDRKLIPIIIEIPEIKAGAEK